MSFWLFFAQILSYDYIQDKFALLWQYKPISKRRNGSQKLCCVVYTVVYRPVSTAARVVSTITVVFILMERVLVRKERLMVTLYIKIFIFFPSVADRRDITLSFDCNLLDWNPLLDFRLRSYEAMCRSANSLKMKLLGKCNFTGHCGWEIFICLFWCCRDNTNSISVT